MFERIVEKPESEFWCVLNSEQTAEKIRSSIMRGSQNIVDHANQQFVYHSGSCGFWEIGGLAQWFGLHGCG